VPLFPDPYLAAFHLPGEPGQLRGCQRPPADRGDPLQRRTFDPVRRREILHDIQRHLAELVYWESYVRNFGPNLGND
jgi:hypothetical protein